MQTTILKYWDRLRSSFWFVPALMAAATFVLAFAVLAVDDRLGDREPAGLLALYSGTATGATAVLQTIAGSMITIAGVVFSLTIVALSLASSQFGPRLLRSFMIDRANQLGLGTFIATFLYCLLVLGAIRHGEGEGEGGVPRLAVTLALVFALASLWVLIYFIHHVSVSIQADQVVSNVSDELHRGIDWMFPAPIGTGRRDLPGRTTDTLPDAFEAEAEPILSSTDGYVQIIDGAALLALATERDLIVRVERRPGHYVTRDMALARVWPAGRRAGKLERRIRAAFLVGNARSPAQDVEASIEQLVEVAVRALSPGVNDPFTAIACVDRLASAFCRLVRREPPSPLRFDDAGRLRVVAPAFTVESLANAAFDPIRRSARGQVAVTVRLLETLTVVAGVTDDREIRRFLQRHAERIVAGARDTTPDADDLETVEARYRAAAAALSGNA